ncbi:DNA topoisomerase IV subunit A, partial [Enterococcus faecalis]|nr:DNA topoisomerase IV subunit A [Enterococcus faecalis]
IAEEETYVSVTRGGYIKRTSPRSFSASQLDEIGKRDEDELIFWQLAKTTQHLLLFTDLGNVIYRPVHELADIKWKDIGEHLSQSITNFETVENVIHAEIVDHFEDATTYFAVTKMGQIKRVERKEFSPWRTYKSKSVKYAKLKSAQDVVIKVAPVQLDDILLLTSKGYALRFNIEDVPVIGAKAAGVKAINLKGDDTVAAALIANTSSFYLLTQRGSLKRMAMDDIPTTNRANRGLQVLRELKSKPHRVFAAGNVMTEATGDLDLFATEVAEAESQVLIVTSTTGQTSEIALENLGLSER